MNNKVNILTLSKDIDSELFNTIYSVIKSAKNSDANLLKNIHYSIVIKNYLNCKILKKIEDLLENSNLNFEIIPQEKITKEKHLKFKTNGWYEGVYDILKTVKPNSYLWFLNAGDYAVETSIDLINKFIINPANINYAAFSFLTNIKDRNYSFIKPNFFFDKKRKRHILSMLPCFQAILIQTKYLKDFENLFYVGVEGIEMKILEYYFKKNLICFIPECLAIFSYGGTSTTQAIGYKKRMLNIYNFFVHRRYMKLISEIFKLFIDLFHFSFLKKYYIYLSKFRSLILIKIFPFMKILKLESFYISADSVEKL